MKARLKVDTQWLEKEVKSMSKMKKDYESWESETLRRAKEATDLRDLREVFYELQRDRGERWEWDQATGAWLASGEPLDAVGIILRAPGLKPNRERFIVYAVMAYSKGLTDQFDHLGDKERFIIERNTETNELICWSTTGHGALDIFPISLKGFETVDDVLEKCFLVAQPGDHALRLEPPAGHPSSKVLNEVLWRIASGGKSFLTKEISLLSANDVEGVLDFRFYRYAKSVIELEKVWLSLSGGTVARAKEAVLDQIPNHIEEKNKKTLRKVEGLLHVLWFKPAFEQIGPIKKLYSEIQSEPTPTEVETKLVPHLGELVYALNDILEKAQYIKWKSVMDRKRFSESDVFQGLQISNMAKEAFAVALDDLLREHTLSYIGYPEKATMKDKMVRILFGLVVLPARLAQAFLASLRVKFAGLVKKVRKDSEEEERSPIFGEESRDPEEIRDDQ